MDWIKARLKERSTWYGLGWILAGVVSYLAPDEWKSIVAGAIAAAGGAAVVTPEARK